MATTVAPAAPFYDLSMDSNSKTSADIRRVLDLLMDGGTTSLDAATERELEPFASMFQFERVKSPLRLGHVFLLLYAPFGVLLLVFRLLAVFLLALVLPTLCSEQRLHRLGVHAIFAFVTGTIVRVQDRHHLDAATRADIIVANHISEFDALALLKGIGPGYVLGYDFYKKMLFFRLLRGVSGMVYVPYVSRRQGGAKGRDEVREIIMDKLAKKDKPLIAFPEVRSP